MAEDSEAVTRTGIIHTYPPSFTWVDGRVATPAERADQLEAMAAELLRLANETRRGDQE